MLQVQVKPGEVGNFRSLHREEIMPNGQAQGEPWRLTGSLFFGDSFQFIVAQPLANYAQLDSGGGGLSDMGSNTFQNAVEWRKRFVVTTRPDMSIGGGSGVQALRRMARFQVKPGSVPAFEEFWNDTIAPAIRDAGMTGYQVFQTLVGGPQGEYYGAIYLPNFAALDTTNFATILSEREQQEFGELVDEFEVTIQRVDRELSYGLPGL